ncbi:MAG: 3-phosphoshikimate 1-carboxyvinyltransferase [Bacteroidota bacterium]|jgi:3-phosphoshikimate 1-carboxyvinyltransferase
MTNHLAHSTFLNGKQITITGSKSETNRLLLLQALFPYLNLENTSNSDDSEVMIQALEKSKNSNSNPLHIDVHHAGTAMRFLTAFFAIQDGKEVVITGSTRMQERPIHILVEALNQLGATITYEKNQGFPPLRIQGIKLTASQVTLPADVSSQYISALLLIAPSLENGLQLTLEGEITSVPYIKMTLALLNQLGVTTSFEGNQIVVAPFQIQPANTSSQSITVESDWSSASYWYSMIALSKVGTQVTLSSYHPKSLQGDHVLATLYTKLSVETEFLADHQIRLTKVAMPPVSHFEANLIGAPDIAQTIAVTCFGLGISCTLSGLHTLKIKETDRLKALKNELTKLGAYVTVTNEQLTVEANATILPSISIQTYQDHRMAMAFAPLALKVPITILEAEVVSKSYPSFWEDLQQVGIQMQITEK